MRFNNPPSTASKLGWVLLGLLGLLLLTAFMFRAPLSGWISSLGSKGQDQVAILTSLSPAPSPTPSPAAAPTPTAAPPRTVTLSGAPAREAPVRLPTSGPEGTVAAGIGTLVAIAGPLRAIATRRALRRRQRDLTIL